MARTKPDRAAEYGDPTYKQRSVWYYQRAAFPFRDTLPLELEMHWARDQVADVEPSHQWECAGPFNVAGRATSLVVDPRDPGTLFAGTAGGGVWKSQDQGRNWRPSWGRYREQNIGALAYFLSGGQASLIAATGEANMSSDSYPGSGVLVSVDGGLSWQPFFTPPPGEREVGIAESIRTFPRRIGCLAFDRNGRIGLGCVSFVEQMPAALYLDSGGDGLKPCRFWGDRSYDCYSLLFHPESPKLMYTSIFPGGSKNGIWRSSDGGATWEQLKRGLPPCELFRRTTLAFAPSDPDVIYALAANAAAGILGVFVTRDGGKSWREILDGRYPHDRPMSYNNTIAVHPTQPECMMWGGMRLYRTADFGRNWRQITNTTPGRPNYVHSDHHAIVWPHAKLVYSANDGGVSVSEDGGNTWVERTRGMVTTTFYSLDVAASNGSVFGGGTQDNGIVVAGVDNQPAGDFVHSIPGDGSWMVFDGADEQNVFGSAADLLIYHHASGDPWDYDGWRFIEPKQVSVGEATQRAFGVLAIDPSTRKSLKKVWAGTARLWSTVDNGKHWDIASPVFDTTPVCSIAISSRNRRLMFVGTNDGGIFRSIDGGRKWSGDLAGIEIPNRPITAIQVHPANDRIVVAAVASTGSLAKGVLLDDTGEEMIYSHVFLSRDQGETWEDIDQHALPNVVYNTAAFQTHPPYHLFVGGDVGVFMRARGKWIDVSGNLPSVVISSLVYHAKDRTLTAATFGRGIWRIPGRIRPSAPLRRATALPLAVGLREDPRVRAPRLVAPANRAKFGPFPTLTLAWTPVPAATVYQIEIRALPDDLVVGYSSTREKYTLDFNIEGTGAKWRVWAVLPDGLRSPPSGWRTFTVVPG